MQRRLVFIEAGEGNWENGYTLAAAGSFKNHKTLQRQAGMFLRMYPGENSYVWRKTFDLRLELICRTPILIEHPPDFACEE